jgi:outer membrane protein OmpA-like peptidoglycan-associated protein
MRKIYLIILICTLLSTTNVYSQNLAPNGDFERFDKCPQGYTIWISSNLYHNLLPGWNYPTKATSDYFNRCCTNPECAIPENEMGVTEPHSGNGFVGVFLKGEAGYREYIDAQLTEPLVRGQKYCVSLYYKLSTYSYLAVDGLGIYFSPSRIFRQSQDVLTFDAQVKNPDKKFMKNKDDWQLLTGVYEADGTEFCIVIGNFDNNMKDYIVADTTKIPKNIRLKYAYYYIDDVSVVPLKNCKECEGIPHDLTANVVDANFTGGASGEENDGKISLKVEKGTKPYKIEWSNGASGPNLTKLSSGIYTYTVTDFYNCIRKDSIIFSGPLKVTSESSFTGGNSGCITLIPKGGVPPYRYEWDTGGKTKDICGLSAGTYKYAVYDRNNTKVVGSETFDDFSGGLSNIKEGESIVLENIFFDVDKTELLPKSFIELNKIFDFMQKADIKEVEVSGHTDSDGSDMHNQKLSEARAKSVADYLIFMGIEKERLSYIGYGKIKPIATNKTVEGKQKNRRCEFLLMKK